MKENNLCSNLHTQSYTKPNPRQQATKFVAFSLEIPTQELKVKVSHEKNLIKSKLNISKYH